MGEVDRLLQEGERALGQGDAAGALAQFEKAACIAPLSLQAAWGKARALAALGRRAEAQAAAMLCLELNDNFVPALELLDAIEEELFAEPPEPPDSAMHHDLGVAYREMGLFDDAVAEFVQAAQDPSFASASMLQVGQIEAERGRADQAEAALQHALRAPPGSAEHEASVLCELGLLYERRGQPSRARVCYEQAARRSPGDERARERLRALGQRPSLAAGRAAAPAASASALPPGAKAPPGPLPNRKRIRQGLPWPCPSPRWPEAKASPGAWAFREGPGQV